MLDIWFTKIFLRLKNVCCKKKKITCIFFQEEKTKYFDLQVQNTEYDT